jgi:hypothetical protein
VPRYRQGSLAVFQHLGATQIRLASKNFAPVFLFSKREGTIGGGCFWIAQITCFHSSESLLLTQKQNVNDTSYHRYYYPVPSGGLWAIMEEREMPVSLRLRAPGSRGRMPDPLSGLHYSWTRASPTQILALENATRRQPTLSWSPSDPVSGCGINPAIK